MVRVAVIGCGLLGYLIIQFAFLNKLFFACSIFTQSKIYYKNQKQKR